MQKTQIVICLDSDELKAQTLKTSLAAREEIEVLSDVKIMSGLVYRTNVLHNYHRYDLDNLDIENFEMQPKHEHKNYGWYRKFEKKKF